MVVLMDAAANSWRSYRNARDQSSARAVRGRDTHPAEDDHIRDVLEDVKDGFTLSDEASPGIVAVSCVEVPQQSQEEDRAERTPQRQERSRGDNELERDGLVDLLALCQFVLRLCGTERRRSHLRKPIEEDLLLLQIGRAHV